MTTLPTHCLADQDGPGFNQAPQAWIDYLAEQYLHPFASGDVVAEIFRLAWDYGHSSGYSEVEIHFQDLAEIANIAYRELS